MEFSDVPKVKVCCSGSGDGTDRLDKMGALAYGVDGHHDGVIPARFQEFRDEVYADDIPAFFWDRERLEFPGW